jgi:hypothetical protein
VNVPDNSAVSFKAKPGDFFCLNEVRVWTNRVLSSRKRRMLEKERNLCSTVFVVSRIDVAGG